MDALAVVDLLRVVRMPPPLRCRSLFEKHKLLLSFQLASRLALHRGRLPPEQLRFLMQGGAGAGGAGGAGGSQGGAAPGGGGAAGGCPAEIPPRVWAELQALAALPVGASWWTRMSGGGRAKARFQCRGTPVACW